MKNFPRKIITLVIVLSLIIVTLGSVAAQTVSANPAPDFSLIYLINGMDLPKDQFDKTVKLTKKFMTQIQRSDAAIAKMTTAKGNNFLTNPNTFERVTVMQHQFLDNIKTYHIDLVNVIGPEKAMKIFQNVYHTVPVYLLSQTAMTENNPTAVPLTVTKNDEKMGIHPEINAELEKGMHGIMMGRMGTMGPSMNMNSMPMPQNQPMNGSKPDGLKQQILLQLQTSNTILVQMVNVLSTQPTTVTVQNQIQTIKQILANQSALIQMVTTNINTNSASMGQDNTAGSDNSGNMGKM